VVLGGRAYRAGGRFGAAFNFEDVAAAGMQGFAEGAAEGIDDLAPKFDLPEPPDFASKKLAFEHYAKHVRGVKMGAKGRLTVKAGGPDLPEFGSFKEYLAAARRFHSGSPGQGVLEGVRADGDFVRFDPSTGYFGIRTPSSTIRTFFRPDGNPAARLQYFLDQF
jgi:hypothetical protein